MEINIDIGKIDKARIVERKWTNKEGKEITSKSLKLKIYKNKVPTTIIEKEDWKLCKIGFVKQMSAKKEENDKAPIIGDVVEFIRTAPVKDTRVAESDRGITLADVPF